MPSSHNNKSRPLVRVSLPRDVAAKIVFLEHVISRMSGNPDFSSPIIPLTTFATHVNDLAAKEALARTRTIGAAAERDASLNIVEAEAMILAKYVETVALTHPDR